VSAAIRNASKTAQRAKPADGIAAKLARIGILRDEDFVLHLPLRYEDHTRITPLAALRAGTTAQAEGVVMHTDIQYRPRRQLVCLLAGDTATARTVCFNPMEVPLPQGGSQVMFLGLWYLDKLVRTPAGWRISERVEESCYRHNVPEHVRAALL